MCCRFADGFVDERNAELLDNVTKDQKIYKEIMASMNGVAKKAGLKG